MNDDVFATVRQVLPPTVDPSVFNQIGNVMRPEVELAQAKAYDQRPAIKEIHEEMSTLPRYAKHGTVSIFLNFILNFFPF